MTFFLCLVDSEDGGAIGFPEIDWTFLKLKKGQALLWSNVLDSDPSRKHPEMMNELLPVVTGESVTAKVYIHAADWRKENARGCT